MDTYRCCVVDYLLGGLVCINSVLANANSAITKGSSGFLNGKGKVYPPITWHANGINPYNLPGGCHRKAHVRIKRMVGFTTATDRQRL